MGCKAQLALPGWGEFAGGCLGALGRGNVWGIVQVNDGENCPRELSGNVHGDYPGGVQGIVRMEMSVGLSVGKVPGTVRGMSLRDYPGKSPGITVWRNVLVDYPKG